MVKGCQREMILFETRESELFESAWLVLRRGRGGVAAADMLAEANRIIGAAGEQQRKKRPFWRYLIFFAFGMLVGGGLFALISFFLH